MKTENRHQTLNKRRSLFFGLTSFVATVSICFAAETNFYFFTSQYQPLTFSLGSPPTVFQLFNSADALTGIVQAPTNVVVLSNETFATEYECFGWGYESAIAAWTSAVACYKSYTMVHSNIYYDNAGWVTGTKEAYDTWGSFVWFLENTIGFYSSTSSLYVSPHGATSEIACVMVGSLGVYNPQTHVTEVGPILQTNYMGEGVSTDAIFKADITTYYRLVDKPIWKVNDDDSDGDGIPGFADGFNRDGANGNNDDRTPDAFHTWNLLLYNACEPTQATVRITYSSSDPASVTFNGTNYVAASGAFRLWKKNGFQTRNKNSFASGSPGDFVPPGEYLASDLGFTNRAQMLKLYVEPVNTAVTNVILFEVDADGPSGPKGYVNYARINASSLRVELESSVAFNGTFQIHDDLPEMTFENPQSFPCGITTLADPCSVDAPTLLVFRDAVSDSNWDVEPFNVFLKVRPDDLQDVLWAEHNPPIYKGTLADEDQATATYSNLTIGGAFQFDVTVGGVSTRVNLLLPFAGADIAAWFDDECRAMKSWAEAHKLATQNANQSWNPLVTRRAIFRVWLEVSGGNGIPGNSFDYKMDPVDSGEFSPCRRFQSPIDFDGYYGYLTMRGQVVHGSKINNLLWALFGRYWGWSTDSLRLGAHYNQYTRERRLDPPSSQKAIEMAGLIHYYLSLNPSGSASSFLEGTLRHLWDPTDLDEEKLWPSPFLLNAGKSQMERPPSLPTTPHYP